MCSSSIWAPHQPQIVIAIILLYKLNMIYYYCVPNCNGMPSFFLGLRLVKQPKVRLTTIRVKNQIVITTKKTGGPDRLKRIILNWATGPDWRGPRLTLHQSLMTSRVRRILALTVFHRSTNRNTLLECSSLISETSVRFQSQVSSSSSRARTLNPLTYLAPITSRLAWWHSI